MIDENKKAVDAIFDLQFSFIFNEYDVNENNIKILSRLLCREDLDNLLQSTWYLRKKYCAVAITKEELRSISQLALESNEPSSAFESKRIDWDHDLKAQVNINEPLRLIQAVIKPLFIWWVKQITPQIFTLYKSKLDLESQINQCENIKLFKEQQPSNSNDSILSLDDINIKLDADKVRLIIINDLLQKDLKDLINHWKDEPIFNSKIDNTLDYIRNVSPKSELLKPVWNILTTTPSNNENCHQLKCWLLEHSLCLKNDTFLWK